MLQDGARAGERQEPLHLRGRQVRSLLLRRQLVDTARGHEVIYLHWEVTPSDGAGISPTLGRFIGVQDKFHSNFICG